MGKRIALALFLLASLPLANVTAQEIKDRSIIDSLSAEPGNPARDMVIVASRQSGLCLLCHSGPFPEERFQSNLAPELTTSVAHLTVSQLMARIVNAAHFNPRTIMPDYYQIDHLNRVAPKFAGQTILSGQEIEDVIAFLMTLNSQNSK